MGTIDNSEILPNTHTSSSAAHLPKLAVSQEPYADDAVEDLTLWREKLDIEPFTSKDMCVAFLIDHEYRVDSKGANRVLGDILGRAESHKKNGDNSRVDATLRIEYLNRLIPEFKSRMGGMPQTEDEEYVIGNLERSLRASKKALDGGLRLSFAVPYRTPQWYMRLNNKLTF